MLMMETGFTEQSWLVRDVLLKCESFECARDLLKRVPMDSPSYFILAGVKENEGVIISRSNVGLAHEAQLYDANNTWFLVQTNNDNWIEPDGGKFGCHGRCLAAKKALEALGQDGINRETLHQVFMVSPMLNKETLYHTDFQASASYINTLPVDIPAR